MADNDTQLVLDGKGHATVVGSATWPRIERFAHAVKHSCIDDPKTLGRTRLSFASEADIDEFVDVLEKFERGELTPDQWRVFRLVRGTYGQRQPGDVQMLRVKIPQGILNTAQLEALADVGERFSRGFGHITTRQNIQFHFVKLHDVETGDAHARRRRRHHARSLRQLGAQHHLLRAGRRVAHRGLRRDAVRRRR